MMYSFGRDFDEGLEMDNIFREYIERKNNVDFMDGVTTVLTESTLDVQKKVFNSVGIKLMPFVQAAVNGIEAAGFLNIENVCNDKLIKAASKDACDAAFAFYGQFEEYRDIIRAFSARSFLVEQICSEMITVEFLNRMNCL
ncbi:hypothetical protein SDC9_117198 [bioreactor metagenome]|uniref:Uncharacterized protein n=1 Tax=bioreactor metagenome TaxID=1076179 RepID=A0A645BYC0_9ZZZZ|nr:hypothetical protein [Candidatus Metalachnospira sp.]